MRKVLRWLAGFSVGGAVGVLMVRYLSPISGGDIRAKFHERYEAAMEAGREAAAERRAQLEAELNQRLAGQRPQLPQGE